MTLGGHRFIELSTVPKEQRYWGYHFEDHCLGGWCHQLFFGPIVLSWRFHNKWPY